ncbi:MAG: magnesium transporter, partial [Planctomycetes bacterium]|nr:magnesium transporter [Planctomycetota bacterium]
IGGAAALLLWVFGDGELATRLGIIFAWAMVVSMGIGTFTGAAIPIVMKRVGADPAQASAIFLIMITDAVAFSSLLGFAWIALQWMQGN